LSKDGGQHWRNTSGDFSAVGFTSIVRHPADPNVIYATTGVDITLGVWYLGRDYFGMGVLFSTDGGETWKASSLSLKPDYNTGINKIAIDPNSSLKETILYCSSRTEVRAYVGDYKFLTYVKDWEVILKDDYWYNLNGVVLTEPLIYGHSNFNDIEVQHGFTDDVNFEKGIVWFCNIKGLWKYDPSKSIKPSYNPVLTKNYMPAAVQTTGDCAGNTYTNPVRQNMSIYITNQNEIVLMVNFSERESSNCGIPKIINSYVLRSSDIGTTWSEQVMPIGTIYNPIFTVSPSNPKIIYCEGSSRCLHKSTDGGKTFTVMGVNEMHPDCRIIVPYSGNKPDGSQDVLFAATDGGICKTTNGNDWVSITGYGMANTTFNGVAVTNQDENYILGGAQDGNINFYHDGNWYETRPGGDNADCLIDATDKDKVYQETAIDGSIQYGEQNGNDFDIQNSIDISTLSAPLLQHPTLPKEIFAGTKSLITTNNNGADWTEVVPDSPNAISSIAISKSAPNVVYFSRWNIDGGLYKVERTQGVWGNSTEITTSLKTNSGRLWNSITDIAIDPYNNKRIWITTGGYGLGVKVWHTEDEGDSWIALANCTPTVAVTSIVYQEGSQDRIYIGTDFGVYYRDNIQQEWAFYGNNGPRCMVADMEASYCTGKLVVATQGRGMWEVPMLKDENTVSTLNTSTAVTWDYDRVVTSNIVVPNGTTLTIKNCTINFSANTGVTIEPGGKVNILNAKLTNACRNFWKGIQVVGNSTLPQTATNQGTLTLANNSSIEYALCAISTARNGDIATTGAIISASNSTFKNNRRAVEYLKYNSFNASGNLLNNVGSFNQCNFIIDNDYSLADYLCHISIWDVRGIKFLGCSFSTTKVFPFDNEKNIGIRSIDAGFYVDRVCLGNSLPCQKYKNSSFEQLNKAIYATKISSVNSFSVQFTNFTENVIGIQSEAVNSFVLRGSSFKVGKTNAHATAPNVHEGLCIMSGTGFKVEQNTFEPTFVTQNNISTVGIRALETGKKTNKIYKNTFQKNSTSNFNIFRGNLANGDNGGVPIAQPASTGLLYECNINKNNVENGYDFDVTDAGIAPNQGLLNKAAGNEFSLGKKITYSDFVNTGNPLRYYYFKSTSAPFQEPKNYFNIVPLVSTFNNCPSVLPGNENPNVTIANAVNNSQQYDILVNNYNQKIDAGNTTALLKMLNDGNDIATLKTKLTQISPYLSNDVFMKALEKIEVLGKDYVIDLLLKNPELSNAHLQDIKKNIKISATDYTKVEKNVKDKTSVRTTSDLEIAEKMIAFQTATDDVISTLLHDSTKLDLNSLHTWLAFRRTVDTDFDAVDVLLAQSQFVKAQEKLANLQNKVDFSDTKEIEALVSQKLIQINLYQKKKSIFDITANQIAALKIMAENNTGRSGAQARGWLNLVNE
jgi:hypothetical protein